MTQPKEWLAVSLVVLFMLIDSFAKGMIEPDGVLLDKWCLYMSGRTTRDTDTGKDNVDMRMDNCQCRSMHICDQCSLGG
jgi:hypothetical protein